MSSPVTTISGDATITEAAQLLHEEHIGSVIVGADIIEGILTEADIVHAVGQELDLDGTPVSEIMSEPVVTIRPHESIRVAGERMGHNTVKKLPVTDDGEPVGIVTTTDLAHFIPRSRIMMASDPEEEVSEGEFE